jgi:hypothetical protein
MGMEMTQASRTVSAESLNNKGRNFITLNKRFHADTVKMKKPDEDLKLRLVASPPAKKLQPIQHKAFV